MELTMGLLDTHLNTIKSGIKTIEVRLNDEKRRKIRVGDTIRFIQVPDEAEEIRAVVKGLKVFPTFREMYENVSAEDMGAQGGSVESMVENTYEIYTPEQERKYGTLAITIKYVV
ncbi:ASCH domain-containing protein [Lacicoccus qingdaonensis]|uniref:ASC-1 homology (ASCH) domain-containing protein n=1 Tax=Lacicoccus qingdaonensis TaxID=576118 RepID=A0A1G9HDH9_9BACL|nr:ASCH domain-containing protein [Salinicoccus qingdaonensis]SDL10905.1 ASC-1 homology (ASCH) domain-containing protein [Salinicoccus qingdaonensis]